VFVYSFYDSDGDGVGDLQGLIEKLDYINDGDDSTDTDLGCNGIWLMPVMPSTTYHKYDVTDYCDIDAEYGSLDDFKTLLSECHARGINVIIDLVMNHSSSSHPWFTEAVSYLKGLAEGEEPDASVCPYVDYYNFSREKNSGYSQIEGTDWYYEAQFWSGMPDLNLGNEAVRQEFDDIVSFWLDLGVDGFRLDAAKEYYSGKDDANVEVLTWFSDMVKAKKEDAYIVAEVWNNMTTYTKYYASGIDSCFNFSFADSSGTIANVLKGASGASSYGSAIMQFQDMAASYSDSYIDAPFYTNHDMGRSAGYYAGEFSANQTKMAQALNLWMSGSAFLYYGEELGMKGSGKDENARAPMYWSMDSDAEGMCDGPKDMDTIKMKFESLNEQQGDGDSVYNFVKQVIAIRNAYPEIARGTATLAEDLSNDYVCAIRKEYEGSEVLIVYNLSQESQTVNLSGVSVNSAPAAADAIGGVLLTGEEDISIDGESLILPAYSAVVFR
jgi:glycosidase